MGNEDLRDLLKSGYDTHAAQLHSGDDYAARHHGRVSRAVGRRRVVRQAAYTGGALASVSALAVGGLAIANGVNRGTASPLGSHSASPSPSPLASPSPSPSPSPTPSADSATGLPAWAAPLPLGPPQGVIVDDAMLRLVLDAQAPAPAAAPPMSVACGAPVGPYVAPVLVDATARILRPDTVYPTFLDASYAPQPGDPLLDLQYGSDSADQFFVAVSTVDHSPSIARGGSADYNAIAQQGVLAADSSAVFAADDVDFLYGAVVVQGGAIIGHADLWSRSDDGTGTLITALSTVNEVSARDADTQLVYDYAVGPLEHMLWCGGAAPAGTVDTYAVVGTRLPGVEAFDYSMMWAGAVEYK
ncbi:MAG: hypothetical protein HGA51_04235 [Demequinaceae bacterium]|nr:hypothetical protein [Demequinaceae bacterium]